MAVCSSHCRGRVSWSELPKELIHKISNFLDDDETQTLRLRAVCSSWRSATPPPQHRFPRRFPFHLSADVISLYPERRGAYFTLIELVVYLLQSPEPESQPNFWVVRIERSEEGKIRILNPLTHHRIEILRDQTFLPKVLNTLNFPIFMICKVYDFQYENPTKPKCRTDDKPKPKYFKKVVASPCINRADEYFVMAIDFRNNLLGIKSGDENWTNLSLDFDSSVFVDVLYHNDQFYSIDLKGNTWFWSYDSSFVAYKIVSYDSSPAPCLSNRHLVELKGEIFMVEEMLGAGKRKCKCIPNCCICRRSKNTVVGIRIYRIHGGKWVEDKKLNGRIIFIGDDCSFSVSPTSSGCKGTRVFYMDEFICFHTVKIPHLHSYGDDDGYGEEFDLNNYYYCDCDCDEYDDNDGRDNFVPREDVKVVFKGLNGHNSGVCDFATEKIGSLVRFPELAAGIFWPPPSWINCS